MPPQERRAAFEKWDSKVISVYADGHAGVPCLVTFQGVVARNLVLVVSDLAVRSAAALGVALATLDHARMRNAALAVAIERYLDMAAPLGTNHDRRLVERILAALVHRSESATRSKLMHVTVALPGTTVARLDEEIRRVLDHVDTGTVDDWPGDLTSDVRSCVIEAAAAEWMHQRAESFGTALGRDRTAECASQTFHRRPSR